MAELSRRVKALAKRLGVPESITDRDEVIRALNIDSEKAAEEVRLALQRFIDQINNTSIVKPLLGYVAVKEQLSAEQRVVLPKSKVDLSNKYQWQVYVQSPNPNFNLFDLMDAGRPALPVRTKEQGPYPLYNIPPEDISRESPWSTTTNNKRNFSGIGRMSGGGRVRSGGSGQFTIARSGPSSAYARGNVDKPEYYTQGPVREVKGLALYERALAVAKDRLAGSEFDEWDVILAQKKG